MKKIFSSILFLFVFTLYAQFPKGTFSKDPILNNENFDKQRVYWGYLVGDLRLQEYINLRFEPGLYYTQRNLTFTEQTKPLDALREVNATYIHFPLLLKFSSLRTGNVRPYLLGGISTTLNLSSNSKSIDDNYQQRFRVKNWTKNYELGFGVDLYLEYFKFSPSIRGVFGIGDEFKTLLFETRLK